jgi:hypothetical protein
MKKREYSPRLGSQLRNPDQRGEARAVTASDQAKGTRDERFSYVCNRCRRCCHRKFIRLNPYEIARLARNQGQTTSAFQTASTTTVENVGVVLRQREDDASCVFLGPEGCTVHSDRPLACRLYPLGRQVSEDGIETWTHTEPHPQSEGEYGAKGVIADFITGQDTALYIQATDEYAGWVRRAVHLLSKTIQVDHNIPPEELAVLTDPDTAIAAHCNRAGELEPIDTEERKRLHLAILHGQLDAYGEEKP